MRLLLAGARVVAKCAVVALALGVGLWLSSVRIFVPESSSAAQCPAGKSAHAHGGHATSVGSRVTANGIVRFSISIYKDTDVIFEDFAIANMQDGSPAPVYVAPLPDGLRSFIHCAQAGDVLDSTVRAGDFWGSHGRVIPEVAPDDMIRVVVNVLDVLHSGPSGLGTAVGMPFGRVVGQIPGFVFTQNKAPQNFAMYTDVAGFGPRLEAQSTAFVALSVVSFNNRSVLYDYSPVGSFVIPVPVDNKDVVLSKLDGVTIGSRIVFVVPHDMLAQSALGSLAQTIGHGEIRDAIAPGDAALVVLDVLGSTQHKGL